MRTSITISILLGVCVFPGAADPAEARHPDLLYSYDFNTGASVLRVTGGFAGIDETLTIEGGFNLHFRADHGDLFPYDVIFRDVHAKVSGGELFADQALDDVLNLTGLRGRFVNDNQIVFTGVESQGFSMMLTATRADEQLALDGLNATTCCDLFTFRVDALANLAPFREPQVIGDMDGNGVLDAFDVDDFEMALSAPASYASAHPDLVADELGDMNGDDVFDAFDTAVFERALADLDEDVLPRPVPEPASLAVVVLAGLGIRSRRHHHRPRMVAGQA